MSRADKVRDAKRLLTEEGYIISSLWSVADVKESYDVTDLVAMQILEEALSNEGYIQNTYEEIDVAAERMNLTKI